MAAKVKFFISGDFKSNQKWAFSPKETIADDSMPGLDV
jgi:hypothetical protein